MIFSSRSFQTLAAIVCLSTLTPSALAVQIAQAPTPIAQTAIDCSAERRDVPLAAINQQIERTRQLVNDRQTDAALDGRQTDAALQSLTETIQAIGRLQDASLKAALLDSLVSTVPNDFSLIERLVNRAYSPTQRQRIVALLPQAVEIAQSLNPGYSAAKTRTLTSIARYYAMMGYAQQSQAVLGQALQASRFLRDVNFQAPAQAAIAQGYVGIRQPQIATPLIAQALQAAQSIANPNRKAEILAQITNIYLQNNQIDRALPIARSITVPYYQAVATAAIANRYLNANQIDRAAQLAQEMSVSEQKATLLGEIAARYAANGQSEQAGNLFSQALDTAGRTRTTFLERQQVAVPIVLRYAEAGQLDTALNVIENFDQPTVKAPAFGAIATLYANAGQVDRAATVLNQALQMLDAIADPSQRQTATHQLIDQAVQAGNIAQALRVVQTIQPNEEFSFDRVDALTDIANQAIAFRNYDAALQVTEAISADNVDLRDRLLVQIARGLTQAGEVDRAQAIAQQESQLLEFRPRVLAAVAAQLQRTGQTDRATALFNQSLQIANAMRDSGWKTRALGSIALEYLTANQPEKSTQLLNQAIATWEEIPDRIDQFSALGWIAENLIAANQYRAAIQVAEVIPEPSERFAKLDQAFEQAVNANDFAIVLPVLDRLGDPVFKTRWLIAIADRSAQRGQTQQAAQFLNQAFQSTRTVPGDESQTIVLRYDENPVTADSDQDRGSFYEAIALRYARLNQTGRALEVARSIQNAQARQQLNQRIGCYR